MVTPIDDDLHQVVVERLRRADQRYTAGRRAIVELLVAADDEFARYELAEDLTEHHHHLLCVRCGAVIDVTPSRSLERAVTKALGALAEAEGFEIHSHRLDGLGTCATCRADRRPDVRQN